VQIGSIPTEPPKGVYAHPTVGAWEGDGELVKTL